MSGGNVIAEYDGNHNLLRKFVYVPRVDEPVCMIDAVDSNEPYYYHFDSSGSFMASSDVNNVVVEKYAYDAFGQPAIHASTYTVGNSKVLASSSVTASHRALLYVMPEDGAIQSISKHNWFSAKHSL